MGSIWALMPRLSYLLLGLIWFGCVVGKLPRACFLLVWVRWLTQKMMCPNGAFGQFPAFLASISMTDCLSSTPLFTPSFWELREKEFMTPSCCQLLFRFWLFLRWWFKLPCQTTSDPVRSSLWVPSLWVFLFFYFSRMSIFSCHF